MAAFRIAWPVPDGIAVVAGLAVQEAQLLEGLAEDVFAAHCVLKDPRKRCRVVCPAVVKVEGVDE